VPGIAAATTYRRAGLRGDGVAGLAVGALLVPQGMAYAELAGLPPVTGLWATVVALVAYAVVGPSPLLVLGPDSSLAPLIAAGIALVGTGGDPERAVQLGALLAVTVGLICLLARIARLAALTELLSRPVLVGYLNGIAVVVIVSQLPRLCGFSVDADDTAGRLRGFVSGLAGGEVDGVPLAIGFGGLVAILLLRHAAPKVPGVLVAVIGGMLAVTLGDLDVPVVGAVPRGLPAPASPFLSLSFDELQLLVAAAAGIAFVALADTVALSRSIAARSGWPTSPPARELGALGLANLAAGAFRGFPVSASTSRTAVALASGAHTQLAGLVGAGVVAAVLVAGHGLGRNLPLASLAALVVAAGLSLLDLATLRWLARVRRSELVLSVTATLGVALVGVLEGILVAVGLSLGYFVRRAWRPYAAVLGRVEGQKGYHDVERHPEGQEVPGLLIYRFDAPIFFANADHFVRNVRAALDARQAVVWIVLAAEPITDVDTTGAAALAGLLDELDARGVELAVAELKGPVKDRLRGYGLYDRIGDDRFFPTLGTAIDAYLAATGTDWTDWTDRD
jgi:high affinity sulfate transporter 1